MKNSVHTSIIQLLSKFFLATYTREKDELFGKKEQNLSLKSRGSFRLFLVFNVFDTYLASPGLSILNLKNKPTI